MIGQCGIHTVPVGLTEGTLRVRLPNGVRMLRDCLTGLGILAGTGGLGRPRLPTVHTTVGGTWYSTITARGTLTSNTLARLLAGGLELLELGSQRRNFSKEGLHFCLGIGKGEGDLGANRIESYLHQESIDVSKNLHGLV